MRILYKVSASLILLLFISGCVSAPVPSPTEQGIFESSQTFNDSTPIPTRPPSQTSTPDPTPTSSPEPENPILISRTYGSGDGVDEITSCIYGFDTYNFVLYRDGHLIIYSGSYMETLVPQSTINKLMDEIQATGFYSLTGYDDQYIETAPTALPSGWSWGSNITVNDTSVNLRGDISSDYEVEAVQKTKHLINDIATLDLKPYKPDIVLMYVFSIDNPSFDAYDPQPSPPLLNWARDEIHLDTLSTEFSSTLSGDPLIFLMQQIKTIPAFRIVEQEGKYYLVAACPYFE